MMLSATHRTNSLVVPRLHLPCTAGKQPAHCHRPWMGNLHRPQQPHAAVVAAAKAKNNSFDADDELDTDLAEELSKFRSPDAWNKVAQHLDLVWKVGRVSDARGRGKRSVCTCCHGSGEEECAWCHGTGAMMVGDTLFRSGPDGGSHCPICQGKGHVACENCRGTGYRASWLQGPDHCRNPT